MLHPYDSFGPYKMCEKVRILLMLIYFCTHLTCFAKLAFVIFEIINFLSFQALHVCSVA
jgi:hypothetical protein